MVVVTTCSGGGWIFVVVDTEVASEDLNAWIAPTRRVSGSSEHTPLIHAALLVRSDAFGEWAMCLLRVPLW
jgi:hypothetical protein